MPKRPEKMLTMEEQGRTLTEIESLSLRQRVDTLISWLREVPDSWLKAKENTPGAEIKTVGVEKISSLKCESWGELLDSWKAAMRWRQTMDDVLSCMLALAITIDQKGDQLFLMVIGNASGGKTTFCDGLLVSTHCYALESLTGFFSGFQADKGKDYSAILRANHKLMITPEGDVMVSNPKFPELMSQGRRIFDGVFGATYKNTDEDKRYAGLRTPWIMVGTHTLLETDQSRLGDRFLKILLDNPEDDERREILSKSARSAYAEVCESAVGEELSEGPKQQAFRMTGGYVDYLFDNATKLLREVNVTEEDISFCETLGEFVAFMRARPGKMEDSIATREEPYRLGKQFVRLMTGWAAVLNRPSIDNDLLRRLRKVAMDTSIGPLRDITECLARNELDWHTPKAISTYIDRTPEYTGRLLKFMREIGIVETKSDREPDRRAGAKPTWGLTLEMRELWNRLHEDHVE